MTAPPRFSVVTPVCDPTEEVLQAMFASVHRQTHGDWEHCIADDGSTEPHVRRILDSAAADSRVRVTRRATRGGIVAATNDALAMATGEFVAFLDHDDELHPDALGAAAAAIDAHDDVDFVYTDEDKVDVDGRRFDPFLKPDWSPERLRCQMYTGHLSVIRRSLVADLGAMREGYDGSQDWDLVLRVTERARRIVHVPKILYHWRAVPGSAAADRAAKPWALEAAERAIASHLERTEFPATVEELPDIPGVFRLRPQLRQRPLVSIVIPTAGVPRRIHGAHVNLVENCVRSVVTRSTYDNYEIVVVADAHTPQAVLGRLREIAGGRLRIVTFAKPFSFSEKVNLGVVRSRGNVVLLLNDDTEVLPAGWRQRAPGAEGRSDWIEAMLMYALEPGIGAVGAKLYFADRRIQHVGIISHSGMPGHSFHGYRSDYPGYFSNARIPVNYLAATGACLMTRRDVFEEMGGLSLIFPINFNDVDYGFKLHTRGYRTVVNPDVELLHYESSSRTPVVTEYEHSELLRHWKRLMWNDPYYPRIASEDGNFVLPPFRVNGTFANLWDDMPSPFPQ